MTSCPLASPAKRTQHSPHLPHRVAGRSHGGHGLEALRNWDCPLAVMLVPQGRHTFLIVKFTEGEPSSWPGWGTRVGIGHR